MSVVVVVVKVEYGYVGRGEWTHADVRYSRPDMLVIAERWSPLQIVSQIMDFIVRRKTHELQHVAVVVVLRPLLVTFRAL